MQTSGTLKWLGLAIGAVVMLALPQIVTSSFAIDILIRILLFSFIGVAWNLMGGLEWSALPIVCDLLGVTDPELLITHLVAIRDHQNANRSAE